MKTIIFDFGNVVGFFDHYRALAKLAPFTTLSQEAMYQLVYDGNLEDVIERGALEAPIYLEQVRQLWKLDCDVDFLADAVADVFWPNLEVCELIPKLQGRYRILLGSNTNAVHSGHFRKQFADVLGRFDALVLSHEIGARKPTAAFFQHCHSLADAEPHECVFVDDLPSNIAGAHAIGFRGIVYQPGQDLAGQLGALGVSL